MQKEVFIPESRKHKWVGFGINLFLVFGLLLLPDFESLPHMPEWYNKLDLYLSILLGIPLLWQLNMLFRNTGITLTPRGIVENLSQIKTQLYEWPEITNIQFVKMVFLRYMLVQIKNPENYIKSYNIYKRLSLTNNMKKFGTPIRIPVHFIDKDPSEMVQIIDQYLKELFPPTELPNETPSEPQ